MGTKWKVVQRSRLSVAWPHCICIEKYPTLIHDLSGLFWVVNIKSKVAIFCPIKERINHSARGEFNLSLLSLITVPKKRREDATLSKNAERNYVRVRDAWRKYLRIHCSPLFPDELSRPLRAFSRHRYNRYCKISVKLNLRAGLGNRECRGKWGKW